MSENIKNLLWTTAAVVLGLQLDRMLTKMIAKKSNAADAADEE